MNCKAGLNLDEIGIFLLNVKERDMQNTSVSSLHIKERAFIPTRLKHRLNV